MGEWSISAIGSDASVCRASYEGAMCNTARTTLKDHLPPDALKRGLQELAQLTSPYPFLPDNLSKAIQGGVSVADHGGAQGQNSGRGVNART